MISKDIWQHDYMLQKIQPVMADSSCVSRRSHPENIMQVGEKGCGISNRINPFRTWDKEINVSQDVGKKK
jgi:hypothetical protein